MKSIKARKICQLLPACIIALAGFISSHAMEPVDQSAVLSPAGVQTTEQPLTGLQDSEELYQQLAESCREYEEGIQFILEGDANAGEQKTVAAIDQLFAGIRKCMKVKGCDSERFFNAIAGLLNIQQDALKEDSLDIAEFISDAADSPENISSFPSLEASLGGTGGNESLLRGKDLRELIELNEPVKAALNDWLTWMRPLLMEAYENYQYLRDKIAPIYLEAGLPEALLFALMATETGGKVHAYSRAGAAGPLQFMRQTGRRYGLTVTDGFDMRLDPVASTKANVSYLNEQLGALNQSLEKTLAAYNGGENRVKSLNRRLKGISFWDSKFYNSLPSETREYVPRILAAAWLFLHPEDYNLQFPQYHPETSTLAVKQDIALDELSICLGQEQDQSNGWFRTLRNLNPRLEAGALIKAGEEIEIPTILKQAYEQKCIEGELIERARELHDAGYPEMILYTVVNGDTLGEIAARYRCTSTSELATLNNLRAPRYLIRIGQTLKIPGCP